MTLDFTPHFLRSYKRAPAHIKEAFHKQSLLLLSNPRHPSLRVKKYDESQGLWQARLTGDWRFYFKINGSVYRLEEIKAHPK